MTRPSVEGRAGPAVDEPGEGFADLVQAEQHALVRLPGLPRAARVPGCVAEGVFGRLHRRRARLRRREAAFAYLRSAISNLTRNRHRHLRMARGRQRPEEPLNEAAAEHAALMQEDGRELLAALD